MKKPKCRTCGEQHALGACKMSFKGSRGGVESRHAPEPSVVKGAERSSRDDPKDRIVGVRNDAELTRPAGVASGPRDSTFDKTAYQRDYMRRRRAAAKADAARAK